MLSIEKNFQSLETLYLELESRLESQYQDLLSHRLSDSHGEHEHADLERRLLDAEKLLVVIASSGSLGSLLPVTEGVSTAKRAASLQNRAQHLLDLVKRNVAQCTRLQSSAKCGLHELQRGERFLQGVRGYREHQPRFFDSHQ